MLDTRLIDAKETGSRRLMIVLHGLGDSMAGYEWWPEAMNLPWLNYLLVNAPDPYYGGFSWYEIDHAAPGVERSRKILFDLLDNLAKKNFPPDQIVFGGFSQGCLMSIEIGARYPHRLAGIVGISGYVHDPAQLVREFSPAAKRQRFLITHGRQDSMIPIEQVRPQMEILKQAGLQIEWREFNKAHTIAGEPEMEVIREFVRNSYA